MGVYKEIAKADGSGITTFYRLSEENSTVETTSTGTTKTMFDYNDVLNKPSINDVALVGNKTLEDLGIQPAGNYLTEIPTEYVTEDELEAKDYATEAFVIDQINNAEHFHREIVDALPLTGKDNVLYLVPKAGSGKDIYNEYIWTGVDYEFMGTTAVDLSDYYKKGEVDTLLDNKVTKVNGKQLSTNDYTTAEKTKLASLENYDDSELRGKVDALHNYDDTEVRLDINSLKTKTTNNEIDITSIENELGYKAEVIRLVKSGDWWLCQDAKGNNLTLEMAMNRLGLPKTILLLENLENDGKYYPVEYELKEKYIDIIYKDLEGITHHLNYGYNEYYTNTASRDYIHLEDSINYPYKKLEVEGVCKQETTSGKNLLNIEDKTTTSDGMTITSSNGIIKVSGTPTNTYTDLCTIENFTLRAGTYYFSKNITGNYSEIWFGGTKIVSLSANVTSKSFTLNEDKTARLAITLGNLIQGTATTINNIKVMLSTSSDTTWEKYTGTQPSPSPDYPQEIKTIENSLKITSCNKNLFDKEMALEHQYKTDGSEINKRYLLNSDGNITINYSNAVHGRTFFNKMKLNAGTYTLSFNAKTSGTDKQVWRSVRNMATLTDIFTSSKIHITDNNRYSIQFTLYEPTLISISINPNINDTGTLTLTDIQLEKGTQATPFDQHLKTQITANLPEGEFIGKINDTYKDTLKVEYNEEDGQYHLNLYKNIGKVVLDGSEIWGFSGSGLSGLSGATTVDTVMQNMINGNFLSGLCSHFKNTKIKEVNTVRFGANNKYIYFYLKDNKFSSLDKWTEYLKEQYNSGNPVIVYYVLANHYVVDLGVVDMPITYNEITNLFTDSDLMPIMNIEYYTAILENAKDTIIGQDIYLQNEVDNVSSLPTDANKGDIRRTKDTKDWYIYDGTEWSAFDKASEVDLSNYLAKDNTIAYKPATDYNPSTKKYVDDSIADIFVPTKTSQLTNDSGFVLKTANDLTNYYNKSNTYNKAEVNALVAGGGGSGSNISISVSGDTLVITTGGE